MESSEAERLRLARIAASLTSERDQYLHGLREASERVNALRLAAERADAIHEQQRKEDTATFQANLQRLLSEKASLHDEVELISSQKDVLTEALVQANRTVEQSRIAYEEAEAYKQQHREAAEQLQAGFAERDAARLTAHHHKQQATKLHEQLAAAQKAIEMQSISVDALRQELECSKEVGDEAKRAAQRGATRNRRLEASLLCLSAELTALERAHANAATAADEAERRETCHLATCLAEVATAEETEARTRELARSRAATADAAVAERSAAAARAQESARAAGEAQASSAEQIVTLTKERDGALSELAAQRRVADSLRLELKKAMKAQAQAPAAGAPPKPSA